MNPFRQLWADLTTPSEPDEPLHYWGAIQTTHAVMGALVACLLSLAGWHSFTLGIALTVAYLVIKEGTDMLKGGSLSDSLADTFYVGLGLLFGALSGFPVVLLGFVLAGIYIRGVSMANGSS